jgi:hypothetical protein
VIDRHLKHKCSSAELLVAHNCQADSGRLLETEDSKSGGTGMPRLQQMGHAGDPITSSTGSAVRAVHSTVAGEAILQGEKDVGFILAA